MERVWRLYLDTSVFGGVFEAEEGFDVHSRRVIERVLNGSAILLYSITLEEELNRAPERVRTLFDRIPEACKQRLSAGNEVANLSRAYLDAGVVGTKWLDDTLHIAAATVAGADAIVSWNFKHIVRLDRIKGYNQVNLEQGYQVLTIVSPKEIDFDE